MVSESRLPVFPAYQSVDGMDYSLRRVLAALDISKMENWFDPELCPEEALGPMLRFFGLEVLDTEIFGVAYRRRIYANGQVLREFRGSDHAVQTFNELAGIQRTNYVLVPEAGLPTGIRFSVSTPIGRRPESNWQAYLQRAYRWLLPPYLHLEDFIIGIEFDTAHYARGAFKLRHRIK